MLTDLGDLWTIDEVASYLGVPKQTIYSWRTTGYGPHGFRVGKHLRWRAATVIVERACPRCGAVIHDVVEPRPAGRPRRWCSPRCRRAASEERRAAANGAIAIEYVTVKADLDEHVRAVLDSPTACRRVLRDVRERADAGLLEGARWSSVHSEIERFRPTAAAPLRWRLR